MGRVEKLSPCAQARERERVGKGKKLLKRISWEDEVGGELLKICSRSKEWG